jgi:hypothetical protein
VAKTEGEERSELGELHEVIQRRIDATYKILVFDSEVPVDAPPFVISLKAERRAM